jgi:hypothetical protein
MFPDSVTFREKNNSNNNRKQFNNSVADPGMQSMPSGSGFSREAYLDGNSCLSLCEVNFHLLEALVMVMGTKIKIQLETSHFLYRYVSNVYLTKIEITHIVVRIRNRQKDADPIGSETLITIVLGNWAN